MSLHNEKLVIIGDFGRPYGVKGWLHLNSYTRPKENIQKLLPWQVKKQGHLLSITPESFQRHSDNLIVKLPNCNDRDIAALFTNCEIAVARSQLPPPAKNEYYWTDLEGLTVINRDNITLGKVEYLYSNGANDIMVVQSIAQDKDKKQAHLVPYIDQVIDSVNLEEQIIRVDWE